MYYYSIPLQRATGDDYNQNKNNKMVTNNPSNFLSTDSFRSNTDPSTTVYFSSIPTPTPSVEEVDLNLSSSGTSNRPCRKAAAAASAAANNKKVSDVCYSVCHL